MYFKLIEFNVLLRLQIPITHVSNFSTTALWRNTSMNVVKIGNYRDVFMSILRFTKSTPQFQTVEHV